jgi:hypothetical protein
MPGSEAAAIVSTTRRAHLSAWNLHHSLHEPRVADHTQRSPLSPIAPSHLSMGGP